MAKIRVRRHKRKGRRVGAYLRKRRKVHPVKNHKTTTLKRRRVRREKFGRFM